MKLRAAAATGAPARKLRRCLFDADPHCHWCHRRVRWCTPPNGILPADAATLDHVESQYGRSKHDATDVVLACHECNQARCKRETERMPIEEKWERCQSYPAAKKNEQNEKG